MTNLDDAVYVHVFTKSESVWDAVADNPAEAANLKLRSQLMDALESYIGREAITQTEAALRFGVPRSRVSELVNGRINKFTIDKLVNMVCRVGLTTRITVERSARPCSVLDAENASAGLENAKKRRKRRPAGSVLGLPAERGESDADREGR